MLALSIYFLGGITVLRQWIFMINTAICDKYLMLLYSPSWLYRIRVSRGVQEIERCSYGLFFLFNYYFCSVRKQLWFFNTIGVIIVSCNESWWPTTVVGICCFHDWGTPRFLMEKHMNSSALTMPICMCTAMQRAKHAWNKGWRRWLAFEVTGSNCETVKTVLDNKFNDGHGKSEKDEVP